MSSDCFELLINSSLHKLALEKFNSIHTMYYDFNQGLLDLKIFNSIKRLIVEYFILYKINVCGYRKTNLILDADMFLYLAKG